MGQGKRVIFIIPAPPNIREDFRRPLLPLAVYKSQINVHLKKRVDAQKELFFPPHFDILSAIDKQWDHPRGEWLNVKSIKNGRWKKENKRISSSKAKEVFCWRTGRTNQKPAFLIGLIKLFKRQISKISNTHTIQHSKQKNCSVQRFIYWYLLAQVIEKEKNTKISRIGVEVGNLSASSLYFCSFYS